MEKGVLGNGVLAPPSGGLFCVAQGGFRASQQVLGGSALASLPYIPAPSILTELLHSCSPHRRGGTLSLASLTILSTYASGPLLSRPEQQASR